MIAGDAANPNPRAPARSLGVSAEPVTIGQRTAMKVVAVQPESPGQKAGLEPGDIIVAANGVPITGAEALSAVVRKSGATLSLSVRDTRTGKDTRVDVKLGGDEPGNLTPPPADPATPTGSGKRLGAVTEIVFYDVDPAVKVTEVEPGSAAALAGIEPGDVIIEANGSPVLHPKELDELVRKSGPKTSSLLVVNSRTRQKSSVEVKLRSRTVEPGNGDSGGDLQTLGRNRRAHGESRIGRLFASRNSRVNVITRSRSRSSATRWSDRGSLDERLVDGRAELLV